MNDHPVWSVIAGALFAAVLAFVVTALILVSE